ncbi:MAG: SprT-like domain-containing protein [Planctomycetota bacterium]
MRQSKWNRASLERRFEEFNDTFWDGKLSRYKIRARRLSSYKEGCGGTIDKGHREIVIDTFTFKNDAEIMHALLHEMCHAADASAGPGNYRHGYGFWEQVEMLMRKGVPYPVTEGDMPGFRNPVLALPLRFPHARAAAEELELCEPQSSFLDVPRAFIKEAIEHAAKFTPDWPVARESVGCVFGLIDVGLQPINVRAARILRCGERHFNEFRARLDMPTEVKRG